MDDFVVNYGECHEYDTYNRVRRRDAERAFRLNVQRRILEHG